MRAVLIAVGNLDVREALARLLAPYAPAATTTGAHALVDEVNERPALRLLLMSDVEADSSGLDLLRAVRQCRPDVAVLLLSDRPTVEHATEAIGAGPRTSCRCCTPTTLFGRRLREFSRPPICATASRTLARSSLRRYGFDRDHHRVETHALGPRAREDGVAQRHSGPHRRRNGNGQGADCACASYQQPAGEAGIHGPQLRRAPA